MARRVQIEAAARAIYPLLQDIINGRPLKNQIDLPEFQLAKAALDAIEPDPLKVPQIAEED